MKRALVLVALAACGGGGGDAPVDAATAIDALDPDAYVAPTCDTAIGPQGRCADDLLQQCADGAVVDTDCAAAGQVCTWIDDATGYGCVAPESAGPMRVHGRVRYEDRAPLPGGGLGPLTPVDARGARVAVVRDSDDQVLAAGVVADDGTYVLHYDVAPGEPVHVLVASQNPLPARPITVTNRQGQVHGFGGASFAAATDATADLLVTDESAASEAFNILDQVVSTMDWIRVELGDDTPLPLLLVWARGSNDGTYYWAGEIHLLGASSDDDGYDDTVILHEAGHYVEDSQGRSDSPGGGHDGSPTDPRLAWSEGFSTYWAMAIRGEPLYMDSNAGGGWGYQADTSVTSASAGGSVDQDVSEDMVTEDLWDLADAADGDDDGVAGSHRAVVRVQVEYLRAGDFRAYGVDGVDLVDFLDGWFLATGLAPCPGARGVVTETRGFPYDYAGPAGVCP